MSETEDLVSGRHFCPLLRTNVTLHLISQDMSEIEENPPLNLLASSHKLTIETRAAVNLKNQKQMNVKFRSS